MMSRVVVCSPDVPLIAVALGAGAAARWVVDLFPETDVDWCAAKMHGAAQCHRRLLTS